MKIDSRWKWAAMDRNGDWWFYAEQPTKRANQWNTDGLPGSDRIEGFVFPTCDWKDSLHQLIDGELVKYQEEAEPPAVTRAREILEECGIVDVQGTPADQLKPLVELIEELNTRRLKKYNAPEPDGVLTMSVSEPSKFESLRPVLTLSDSVVYNCYRVPK